MIRDRYIKEYNEYLKFINSGKATYEDLNSEQRPMSYDLFKRQNDKFINRFKI